MTATMTDERETTGTADPGPWVMKLLHCTGRGDLPQPSFLKAFDVEAHDGWGMADDTPDPDEAFKFRSSREAMDAWRAIPSCRPTRPDGRPNRPLTAFTIEVVLLVQAKAEPG